LGSRSFVEFTPDAGLSIAFGKHVSIRRREVGIKQSHTANAIRYADFRNGRHKPTSTWRFKNRA